MNNLRSNPGFYKFWISYDMEFAHAVFAHEITLHGKSVSCPSFLGIKEPVSLCEQPLFAWELKTNLLLPVSAFKGLNNVRSLHS